MKKSKKNLDEIKMYAILIMEMLIVLWLNYYQDYNPTNTYLKNSLLLIVICLSGTYCWNLSVKVKNEEKSRSLLGNELSYDIVRKKRMKPMIYMILMLYGLILFKALDNLNLIVGNLQIIATLITLVAKFYTESKKE